VRTDTSEERMAQTHGEKWKNGAKKLPPIINLDKD
jgi:hypothetical protein